MRFPLLLVPACLALALPVTALAGAPQKVHRAVATQASAHRAPDGSRVFEVRVRGRASAVVVCDLDPVVCTVAKRRPGQRWRGALPSGPIAPGLPASPGHPPGPIPIAGTGPRFRIAVYAFQGSRFSRRDLRGRYSGA
jgi:hypothetical protein